MIDNKKKGNEQPIPIPVLKDGILDYIETGKINKDDLLNKVKEFHKGENRAGKALNAICSTIAYSSALNKSLKKNYTIESFSRLSEQEKNLICMALICLRFPFNYDILFAFSKLFNIQDTVNKQYITDTLASKFGSNLSLEHAIAASLKNLVDTKIITSIKRGLFGKAEPVEVCDFVKEAWIYTWFELNGRKKIAIDDLRYEPFISYLINTDIDWENTKILQIKKDFCNQIWIEKVK